MSVSCQSDMKVLVVIGVLAPILAANEYSCYWNRQCAYQLYGSKTPYDAVRGDIRDLPKLEGCDVISIWTLNRHGNRNPGSSTTEDMKNIAAWKDEIIASYEAGNSQLCAQDIANLRQWTWNATLEVSQSHLTGIGYEELYDIGRRIREHYPTLLANHEDRFYLRPTNEQRTVTSAIAFAHGLSADTNLTITIDDPLERDDIIRPYSNCDSYQQEVRASSLQSDHINTLMATADYLAVQNAVQQRLGISRQISSEDVYSFYELCRFDRSWNPGLQSPWCAVFTDKDLLVLEYRDDIRHYYRNGYGHWTNPLLGGPPLHDLYQTFLSVVNGGNRSLTSYFTHDTMMEMTYSALGLYKDDYTLLGDNMKEDRMWRSSKIGCLSTNIIAVLHRCPSGSQTHRVQVFINERESPVCPLTGCSWDEFQLKFQQYSPSLDFCSLNYTYVPSAAGSFPGVIAMVVFGLVVLRSQTI